MILGINWYREFPKGIYEYVYFKFRRSPGGFADFPPELYTSIKVNRPENLKTEIITLLEKHDQASIFLKQNGDNLYIEISWYHLFDYDFLFALEIEKLLIKENAEYIEISYKDSEFQKLGNHKLHESQYYPKSEFLKIVHSGPKYKNACLNIISITCNLKSKKVFDFIQEVEKLANNCGIFSFYYSEKKIKFKSNLILYLTNGRQGLKLEGMKIIDVRKFEEIFEKIAIKYSVKEGIIGDWENHPSGITEIICIEDKEYHPLIG